MSEPQRVYTSDGRQGVIVDTTSEPLGAPRFVEVQMEDGSRLHAPAELLVPRDDGAFELMVGLADVEGSTTAAPDAPGSRRPREDEVGGSRRPTDERPGGASV